MSGHFRRVVLRYHLKTDAAGAEVALDFIDADERMRYWERAKALCAGDGNRAFVVLYPHRSFGGLADSGARGEFVEQFAER